MFSIFFRISDVVLISYLDRGVSLLTINIKDCLKLLVSSLKEHRSKCDTKNLKSHHDNARPNVHMSLIMYLESQKLTEMGHPYCFFRFFAVGLYHAAS